MSILLIRIYLPMAAESFFYAGVGMVDKTKVLDFLEKNKHTSMHKKTGVFLR